MLKKMVNGKEIICSDEEEVLIRKMWALNEKYPDFCGHLSFDGVSEPFHDIIECKKKLKQLVAQEIELALTILRDYIEMAEENGDEYLKKVTIGKRKEIKGLLNYKDETWNCVEHLDNYLKYVRKTCSSVRSSS